MTLQEFAIKTYNSHDNQFTIKTIAYMGWPCMFMDGIPWSVDKGSPYMWVILITDVEMEERDWARNETSNQYMTLHVFILLKWI